MFNRPQCCKDHKPQIEIFPAGKLEILFFWVTMAYFCGKAVFFALRIREMVFPDEAAWFGIARLFSRVAWLPVDSPASYPFGLVTHIPSLYFFLMGKALVCNLFPLGDLVFLRLVNVGIGVLTIFFAWRLICLLTDLLSVRLLFLTMLTNTLMFTFLVGAVSYDNLVNLLSVMAFYYFCAFSLRRQVMSLLFAIIAVLAGCLTKITFLPLALLFAIAIPWRERGHIREVSTYVRTLYFPAIKIDQLIAWLIIFVLAGAALTLYGGNWLRYARLSPSPDAVVGLENALNHRIFARNYALTNYKNGRISLLEAQRLALRIREESDRQATLNLLEIARQEKLDPASAAPVMGRLRYSVDWLESICQQVFGIMAHKNMLKDSRAEIAPYGILLLFALLGFLMKGRGGAAGLKPCAHLLLFVTAGYLLILMQVVNYAIYQASGVLTFALQGRYTFPVLVPLYILGAYYFAVAWPPRLRLWSTAILGVFFVWGEFPWFLRHVTPDWYF